jgi:hypothetical protein
LKEQQIRLKNSAAMHPGSTMPDCWPRSFTMIKRLNAWFKPVPQAVVPGDTAVVQENKFLQQSAY